MLARACGAEAGIVVNNNAAAVLLVLASLARGREVVVSRGELVEIGGGFRVPEIMAESGCRLVEVGTTNRTRRADYERALGPDTALVLKVHASNYRMVGFVEATPVVDVAGLGVPVAVDAGSGLLDDTTPWLPHAAALAARRARRAPGRRRRRIRRDVLRRQAARRPASRDRRRATRADRRDRTASAGARHARRQAHPRRAAIGGDRVPLGDATAIPLWRMATVSVDALRVRAEAVAGEIPGAKVIESEAAAGGGSLPGLTIPSVAIAVEVRDAAGSLAGLRDHDVVARVADGARRVRPAHRRPGRRRAAHGRVACRHSLRDLRSLTTRLPMRTIATAGHVDHGKSSLVRALTGTDPDRFAEEKARGLTIDLGFAFTTLPSGTVIAFVDVPGHVRFLKNMLAGVGAVQLALLVVGADDGWMPQSEEHLRILELLGHHGRRRGDHEGGLGRRRHARAGAAPGR